MILTKNSPLYLSSIAYNHYQTDFWNEVRLDAAPGGKFIIDLSKIYKPQRFVGRNGEWSTPWPQKIPPGFEMPTYDPDFSKNFNDVSDERAKEIAHLINTKNQKFVVMYSGGIDSTVIMAALIKNLSEEELKNISVCANIHTMIENPVFWKKFIWNKFELFDSSVYKYDDLIEKGYRPITADEGDCIFGTMGFLDLQQNYGFHLNKLSEKSRLKLESLKDKMTSSDVHYSEYKDLIISHWSLPNDTTVGELWYEKFEKNIKTSSVPVISLHDYYWWLLFNLKWLSCAMRIPIYLNDRMDCKKVIEDWAINWFRTESYQKWSMVNNNNGEKIQFTATTYKMAARRYIHDLDKNDWYFFFKQKIGSLGNVMFRQDVSTLPKHLRPNARFGLDTNYNILSIDSPNVKNYIKYHMSKYEIDW